MDSNQLQDIRLPSVRSFASLFTGVFALALAYGLYKGWASTLNAALGAAALAVAAAGIFKPAVLEPLNRAWFKFGLLLGKIVSPIVLGVIFFVVITPVSIVTRLAGRDALRLRKRSVNSYWIDRAPPGPAPDSFKNQF